MQERRQVKRYWISRADRQLRLCESMDSFPECKDRGLLLWVRGRMVVSSQRLRDSVGEKLYMQFVPRMVHVGASGLSPETVEEWLWEQQQRRRKV